MTITLCRNCRKAIAEDDGPQDGSWECEWEGWLHFITPDDKHKAEPVKWIREDW